MSKKIPILIFILGNCMTIPAVYYFYSAAEWAASGFAFSSIIWAASWLMTTLFWITSSERFQRVIESQKEFIDKLLIREDND